MRQQDIKQMVRQVKGEGEGVKGVQKVLMSEAEIQDSMQSRCVCACVCVCMCQSGAYSSKAAHPHWQQHCSVTRSVCHHLIHHYHSLLFLLRSASSSRPRFLAVVLFFLNTHTPQCERHRASDTEWKLNPNRLRWSRSAQFESTLRCNTAAGVILGQMLRSTEGTTFNTISCK